MNKDIKEKILAIKKKMGSDLIILGHYYQRPEILEFADYVGDSFGLSKIASESNAKLIVFCGVLFMAESAKILAKNNQTVIIPRKDAGCPLADFANIEQVEKTWEYFEEMGIANDLIPVTYVNSSVELKAFTGIHNGTCCTSSNAKNAVKWVMKQGKKIFFLPDRNLALNTANKLGIKNTALWNPWGNDCHPEQSRRISNYNEKPDSSPHKADQNNKLADSDMIIWNGHCHVHTEFTIKHISKAREMFPNCLIAVHPESDPEVVNSSDASGSTAFLEKFAHEAPDGSTVIIGTEINFINRIAKLNPNKKILPLTRSLCPNMFKTSLEALLTSLENPNKHTVNIDEQLIEPSKKALSKMLEIV